MKRLVYRWVRSRVVKTGRTEVPYIRLFGERALYCSDMDFVSGGLGCIGWAAMVVSSCFGTQNMQPSMPLVVSPFADPAGGSCCDFVVTYLIWQRFLGSCRRLSLRCCRRFPPLSRRRFPALCYSFHEPGLLVLGSSSVAIR